jgi:glycosyltransferase involved in cell wall biosynthesis
MFALKKKWFLGLRDLTIVTPSNWLAEQVKQSFLKDYLIKVINNGIDLSVFKPQESDFRKKYSLEDKKIILGVSYDWSEKKGIDVFVSLAKKLPDEYKIVLVGTNENLNNILSIGVTQNARELAEIYSVSDLFINPTREDNFPTVNIEALACGTPVLTFRTGGSPEIINEDCGAVVEKDDTKALFDEIIRICSDKPYSAKSCIERAKDFDMNDRFKEYIDLYAK